jgi:methionine sulfoxide reductase heme-binding subunit
MKEVSLKNDTEFQQRLLGMNALIPVLLVAWNWQRGQLGANPVEFVTRTTGVLALIFLVITLSITPVRKLFGWNWLLKLRRNLGLYAFYYALAHLFTYLVFDRNLNILSVPADVWSRPFIAVGMVAFLLMVPLAVTSTNAMIKKLGGNKWALLHRLTYPVIIGGVIHYWMIVKSDVRWPLFFAALTGILLGCRFFISLKKKAPVA